MSRKHCLKLKSKKSADDLDPETLEHIRALGLDSVEDYRRWCGEHGFSRRTRKDWRERCRERYTATAERSKARLIRLRSESKNPAETLRRIAAGTVRYHELTQPRFQRAAEGFNRLSGKGARNAFLRLLLRTIESKTDLLSAEPVLDEYGDNAGNSFVEALECIARHYAGWLRLPEAWQPTTRNTYRQFSSLVRHLFAKYEVPAFMDAVWFAGGGREADRRRDWFLHLGLGNNIRTADLPLPYTKKMAHHFMRAPSHLSVEAALRWGQVLGLGGSERTANAVLTTSLVRDFRHDEFWTGVLRWFIAHPMLDPVHFGPIVDFVRHRKFGTENVLSEDGTVDRRPLDPTFTMKGRTPQALLRRVDEWHRELGKDSRVPDVTWEPSGIGWLIQRERDPDTDAVRLWTIRELTSQRELAAEGRHLRHCVATYGESCRQRCCSIWSLGVHLGERRKRMVTIEVRKRAIVQVRGKSNRAAERARAVAAAPLGEPGTADNLRTYCLIEGRGAELISVRSCP